MSIPLSKAVLCVDCDQVSDAKGSVCPASGSKALVNLMRLLEGTIAPEPISVSELESLAR